MTAMLSLGQAAALIGTQARVVGDPGLRFSRVHTDTRSLQPGDLFVALKGERFDAHDFLPQAKAAGAAAVLAERGLQTAGLSGIEVPDSLAALQRLGAQWRTRHTALQLAAVAGSNGKTTVTQMLASVLRAHVGEAAFATQGNYNNHIGLPLTLLRLREQHRLGVVELGMNHPGEIAVLAGLAQAQVALVNNAQREHQEFMATVEAAALENGAVISALPADGVACFPADDAYAGLWRQMAGSRRIITFATDAAADVNGQAQWQGGAWHVALQTPAGSATLRLQLAGAHNVKNALAATAVAMGLGVPLAAVVQGLQAFEPVKGRSQMASLAWQGQRATLVDDSYNANPDSVLAAIAVLAAMPAPRWLVLGDMAEVGQQGPQFHAEVGEAAARAGIEHLWLAGQLTPHAAQAYGKAGGAQARQFADAPALVAALKASPQQAPAAAAVLVKGSRSMAMERVVSALKELSP